MLQVVDHERHREGVVASRREAAERDPVRVETQLFRVRGEVDDGVGAVLHAHGEGVLRREAVLDAHDDGLARLHDGLRPARIIRAAAQGEAAAMIVDDDGEALLLRCGLVCGGDVEDELEVAAPVGNAGGDLDHEGGRWWSWFRAVVYGHADSHQPSPYFGLHREPV